MCVAAVDKDGDTALTLSKRRSEEKNLWHVLHLPPCCTRVHAQRAGAHFDNCFCAAQRAAPPYTPSKQRRSLP